MKSENKQGRAYCQYMMIILLFLCSCKSDRRMQTAKQIVAEWTGKEILFPKGLYCTSIGQDTTCIDLYSDNFKIVFYVDSAGCTSCRLNQLSEWKKIMAESDSLFSGGVDFLFIFQPKKSDERELQIIFRNNGFSHPVFIDTENEIDHLNKFPSQADYQCFLLDRDNKVIMIGNPSNNTGIWALYKKYISEM